MKKIFLFSLLSVLLMGFSACTSVTDENSLSDCIPGDYSLYFKIDGTKMFDATDIKVDGDKVELPAYLQNVITPDQARVIGFVNKNVELDNVIVGGNYGAKPEMLALVKISDYDGFIKVLGDQDINVVSEKDDIEILSDGTDAFGAVYKKKYAYFFTEKDGEKFMAGVIERVRKNPLSKYEGLAQAIDGDNAMDMVLNFDEYLKTLSGSERAMLGTGGDKMKGRGFKGNFNFEANKMLMNCSMINIDGSEVEKMADVDDINIALLGYVPENFNVVFAGGKPTPSDPKAYDNALASCTPQVRPFLQMILPYIQSIDGSTMVALRLQFPELLNGFNPAYVDGIFMTHMPMDKIQEATANITSVISMYGMKPVAAGDGLYSVDLQGINLYFGAADGYFVVSTVPVSATHSSDLTKYFVNRKSAGVFDGACLKGILPFAPFAVMQSENGTEVKSEVTLDGTTEKFIPAVVQAFSK